MMKFQKQDVLHSSDEVENDLNGSEGSSSNPDIGLSFEDESTKNEDKS